MHLIFDFDNTLVDSPKALFDIYQERYNDYSIRYNEGLITWNMGKLIPLDGKIVNSFFNEEDFFKHLIPYPNAVETLARLSKKHTLEIASLHDVRGMKFKEDYIRNVFPMVDKISLYPLTEKFDKSMCFGQMAFDDRPDALASINANCKILMNLFDWNKECDKFLRAMDFKDVEKYVDYYEYIVNTTGEWCDNSDLFNNNK
jgi:5'(3')-deoxyribonucleotidase